MPLNHIPRIVATVAKQASGTADHLCWSVIDCIIPHAGTAIIWGAAVATDSTVIEILAGALTGALAMGWAFAAAAEKGERQEVFRRCGIHGGLGLFWGIVLAYQFGGPSGYLPNVPRWALAGLSAGISGAIMVALRPLLPGYVRDASQWVKRRVFGIESDERPKTKRHPDVPYRTLPKKDISGDETQRIQ